MSVVVDKEKCKGCKLCVAACPYAAISMQEKKAVVSSECINCGACIDSCEFEAITFEGSPERIRMDVAPFKGIYVFIEHDNQTFTLQQAGKFMESHKRDLRKNIWEKCTFDNFGRMRHGPMPPDLVS